MMQYALPFVLVLALIVQQVLHERQTSRWMRILSESHGIPGENMEPKLPIRAGEKPPAVTAEPPRRISVPIPMGAFQAGRTMRPKTPTGR